LLTCISCSGPAELKCHYEQAGAVRTDDTGGLEFAQSCESCTANCAFCNDQNTCGVCKNGTYLSSGSCINCIGISITGPDCDSCDANKCIRCKNGAAMVLSISKNNLISGPPPCHRCSDFVPFCAYCNYGPVCTECSSGYGILDSDGKFLSYTVNKFCTPCNRTVPLCLTCVNGIKCSTCNPGFCPD
jgi:hypothetical protein